MARQFIAVCENDMPQTPGLLFTPYGAQIDCPAADMVVVEYVGQFDLAALGINTESVLQTFGWGLGAVLLFWSLGYAVGVAVDLIKKV